MQNVPQNDNNVPTSLLRSTGRFILGFLGYDEVAHAIAESPAAVEPEIVEEKLSEAPVSLEQRFAKLNLKEIPKALRDPFDRQKFLTNPVKLDGNDCYIIGATTLNRYRDPMVFNPFTREDLISQAPLSKIENETLEKNIEIFLNRFEELEKVRQHYDEWFKDPFNNQALITENEEETKTLQREALREHIKASILECKKLMNANFEASASLKRIVNSYNEKHKAHGLTETDTVGALLLKQLDEEYNAILLKQRSILFPNPRIQPVSRSAVLSREVIGAAKSVTMSHSLNELSFSSNTLPFFAPTNNRSPLSGSLELLPKVTSPSLNSSS